MTLSPVKKVVVFIKVMHPFDEKESVELLKAETDPMTYKDSYLLSFSQRSGSSLFFITSKWVIDTKWYTKVLTVDTEFYLQVHR